MSDDTRTGDATLVARIYVLLAGATSVEEFITELAGLAADEVDRGLSCGLAVCLTERPVSIASSDDLAAQLDEAQYAAGEGPGLDAIATGEPVEVDDLGSADRWREWCERGREEGLQKSLAVPLIAGDTTLGALNMYSTSAEQLTDADRDAISRFAAQAAGALAVATRLAEQVDLANHLESALHSRAVVDQATGIVMAERHCSADAALTVLGEEAQQSGARLRDVAADVVNRATGRGGPEPDPSGAG